MFASRFLRQAAVEKRSKMQTLHKILTGEVQFKNKALVKESNVELMFGAGWKKEFEGYVSKLPANEKTAITTQIQRLALTRYNTRELAMFATEGAAKVDAKAQEYMVQEGSKMMKGKGDAAFNAYVAEEAKLANWTDDMVKKYVAAVKAAK